MPAGMDPPGLGGFDGRHIPASLTQQISYISSVLIVHFGLEVANRLKQHFRELLHRKTSTQRRNLLQDQQLQDTQGEGAILWFLHDAVHLSNVLSVERSRRRGGFR